MSNDKESTPKNKSHNDLKAEFISQVLRAQKLILLDANKANSSANILAIVKKLIPKNK